MSTTVCSYFTANCGDYCVVLHPNTIILLFIIGFWLCLQANQSVFILYDVEKINYIKECIRQTAVKGKKALLFAPSCNETIYFLNNTVHS